MTQPQTAPHQPTRYPEGTDRDDMAPLDALSECYDLWGSGAWPDENAVYDLEEVMRHIERLLGRAPSEG